jgi:hypothetical protein
VGRRMDHGHSVSDREANQMKNILKIQSCYTVIIGPQYGIFPSEVATVY